MTVKHNSLRIGDKIIIKSYKYLPESEGKMGVVVCIDPVIAIDIFTRLSYNGTGTSDIRGLLNDSTGLWLSKDIKLSKVEYDNALNRLLYPELSPKDGYLA
jgi:hypothetical protein